MQIFWIEFVNKNCSYNLYLYYTTPGLGTVTGHKFYRIRLHFHKKYSNQWEPQFRQCIDCFSSLKKMVQSNWNWADQRNSPWRILCSEIFTTIIKSRKAKRAVMIISMIPSVQLTTRYQFDASVSKPPNFYFFHPHPLFQHYKHLSLFTFRRFVKVTIARSNHFSQKGKGLSKLRLWWDFIPLIRRFHFQSAGCDRSEVSSLTSNFWHKTIRTRTSESSTFANAKREYFPAFHATFSHPNPPSLERKQTNCS